MAKLSVSKSVQKNQEEKAFEGLDFISANEVTSGSFCVTLIGGPFDGDVFRTKHLATAGEVHVKSKDDVTHVYSFTLDNGLDCEAHYVGAK